MTVVAQSMNGERDTNFFSNEFNLDNLEIPIVGYEIMEERARFTVLFSIYRFVVRYTFFQLVLRRFIN